MSPQLSAARAVALVDGFAADPAYAGLAHSLAIAVGDGRIPTATRLPSERDLAAALGLSRTTVTRAYALLCERGYAAARRGSGTFTRIPGGRGRTLDRTLTPRAVEDDSAIDLNCAASSALPGIAEAYAAALGELPAYLSGHGYYPAGLPALQSALAASYDARGLPTRPEQILVTSGALGAVAVAARALVRAGDRVLVEAPGYPNARLSFAGAGARLIPLPVDEHGWDLDLLASVARQLRAAYLVPDFHNPTGQVLGDRERHTVAEAVVDSGAVAVVDESLAPLALEGQSMPRPLAAYVEERGGLAVTVGGASKVFWGGLRVGWLRVPDSLLESVTSARLTLDLGSPVLEQLALLQLLDSPGELLTLHRARLRSQRDVLAGALREALPDWRFGVPSGGLALWCTLPRPDAVLLAAQAEARGVAITPGPVFAPAGGFAAMLRVPFTRPAAELVAAVGVLAESWATLSGPSAGASTAPSSGPSAGSSGTPRPPLVA